MSVEDFSEQMTLGTDPERYMHLLISTFVRKCCVSNIALIFHIPIWQQRLSRAASLRLPERRSTNPLPAYDPVDRVLMAQIVLSFESHDLSGRGCLVVVNESLLSGARESAAILARLAPPGP